MLGVDGALVGVLVGALVGVTESFLGRPRFLTGSAGSASVSEVGGVGDLAVLTAARGCFRALPLVLAGGFLAFSSSSAAASSSSSSTFSSVTSAGSAGFASASSSSFSDSSSTGCFLLRLEKVMMLLFYHFHSAQNSYL